MSQPVSRFATDDSGVTAIEYGLFTVVVMDAVSTAGTSLSGTFSTVVGSLQVAYAVQD